ncbi:MAG TPA: prepilin-type N-terminal cleavage/methylation domain-containing protein [Acidimicrobiales bacterium]|nr:prepilin-type N-terminal cleavage/methylation domain-containing protein [Acidimicrobiales bacterium]
MSSTSDRFKHRRDAGETNGFTMIELLIVVVVIGILAAVVIFALGGIAGKSAIAACQADGATMASALAIYNSQNAGTATSTATQALLLSGTAANGYNPYLDSWPSNPPHYAFAIATAVGTPTGGTAIGQLDVSISPAGAVSGSGTYIPYTGPTSCDGVS